MAKGNEFLILKSILLVFLHTSDDVDWIIVVSQARESCCYCRCRLIKMSRRKRKALNGNGMEIMFMTMSWFTLKKSVNSRLNLTRGISCFFLSSSSFFLLSLLSYPILSQLVLKKFDAVNDLWVLFVKLSWVELSSTRRMKLRKTATWCSCEFMSYSTSD